MKSQSRNSYTDPNEDPVVKGTIQHHDIMKLLKLNATKVENKLDREDRKVLLLHTGGTIGMFDSPEGLKPERDRFLGFLKGYPYFCDAEQTFFLGKDDFIISPLTVYGRRIWFKLVEMDQLLDSSNMTPVFWNKLVSTIQQYYNDYDAFVILHGTDTMAYTASALSFMIQNLAKTIVLTGAQIPIFQTRNDSINNLLCSLILAGHFTIPQVLVVFDNKVLRGNRCKKRSSSSLDSFYCPNFPVLGHFGAVVQINWDRILPPPDSASKPVRFHQFSKKVANIKLSPGTPTIPTQKYVVLESFGCGNVPTFGPVYDWILGNSKLELTQKQFIINVSQIQHAEVVGSYEAGLEALKLGVVSGGDMTFEAAFAKLNYLASCGYGYLEIREKMKKNLCGELTEKNVEQGFVNVLASAFEGKDPNFIDVLQKEVFIALAIEKKNKLPLLQTLVQKGMSLKSQKGSYPYPHRLCMTEGFKTIGVLEFLVKQGVDLNELDREGCTCLYYALITKKKQICEWLSSQKCVVRSNIKVVTKAIQEGDIDLIKSMHKHGETFEYRNLLGQNVIVIASLYKQHEIVQFLKSNTTLLDSSVQSADKTGRTTKQYLQNYAKISA